MSRASHFIIVVGIDFSELSGQALNQALELATLHEGAEVHVLYVQPESLLGQRAGGGALDAETGVQHVQQNATEHVARMSATLDKRRLRRVVAHFRQGPAAENVAQLAADLNADLVVIGSHGHRGIERFFLGSIAERVSRLARCQVLIVRPKDHATAGRVPEIEPMCPDCLARRTETGGAELWCARHSEHHLRPHLYSYTSEGLNSAETAAYASTPERGA